MNNNPYDVTEAGLLLELARHAQVDWGKTITWHWAIYNQSVPFCSVCKGAAFYRQKDQFRR